MSAPSATASLAPAAHGRYEHIDALRALAVMLVVVAHAGLGHVVPGGSGVTIFFAISGFIITHVLLVERERTGHFRVSDFYLRRLLKLAPPFLLVMALPTLVYSTWGPIDWGAFVSQVFFGFNWVYVQGLPQILPGSVVVWSLAIEEQFYIVFALVWLAAARVRRRLALLTVLALATVVGTLVLRLVIVAGTAPALAHRRVYYGTDTRVDGIAYGILAAVVFAHLRHDQVSPRARAVIGSTWVPVVSAALYLASLTLRDPWFRETFRYTVQGAAAALVILYGLERQDGRFRHALGTLAGARPVQVVGLASYSIYLVHRVAGHALRPLIAGWPLVPAFLLTTAVGVALGIAIWHLLERPVEAYKTALMDRRRLARTSTPPQPASAA
ncbi:acyltransferase [uncultured Cellulomonas sp.]|uniref:acyltransferase family protein n=1 Tax=uncultured Cellulomonas sp. TaxID=189682 RepID=UPI0028E8CFCC|nr:acyltransferase [uncultured Cellulomonas sp.]